jgi:hypothetical protein
VPFRAIDGEDGGGDEPVVEGPSRLFVGEESKGSVCGGEEGCSRGWLCGEGDTDDEAELMAKGASLRFFCDEAVLASDCSPKSSH